MTSIPPSSSGTVSLNITVSEPDKKSTSAMSLARQNSLAFKEFILSKAFEEMGFGGRSTFKRASNLSKLLEKMDDVKGSFSGGEALIKNASQSDGGSKVAVLNIFHPDYDANNLSDENRDILRAASYFEGIDFNNLQSHDFDKFDQVTKDLEVSLMGYGFSTNDPAASDAESSLQTLLNDLKGKGIVV